MNEAEKKAFHLSDLTKRLDAMIGDMCFPVDCCKLPEEIIKIDVGNGFGRYYDKERRAKHPLESDQIPPMWADEVNPLTDFDLISKAPLNKKALEIHEEARRTGIVHYDAKDVFLMNIFKKKEIKETEATSPWLKRVYFRDFHEMLQTNKSTISKEMRTKQAAEKGFMRSENITIGEFEIKCEKYLKRSYRIAYIEKTFEDVKKPLHHHPLKPHLTAVKERNVLPNEDLWKFQTFHLHLDNEPMNDNMAKCFNESEHEMIRRMFKLMPMQDETRTDLVYLAYCIPNAEAIRNEVHDIAQNCEKKTLLGRQDNFLMVRRLQTRPHKEEKERLFCSKKIFLIEHSDRVSYTKVDKTFKLARQPFYGKIPKMYTVQVNYREPSKEELDGEADMVKELTSNNGDDCRKQQLQ